MLDLEYVKDAAGGIAHYLRRHGQVCELAYTPGNGTLYEIVVIPADGLGRASHWMDHAKARSIREDRPELVEASADPTWILFAWVGHGCWPVDLAAVWSPGYFVEKFAECTIGDADALRALLLEVADTLGLRRLQVA